MAFFVRYAKSAFLARVMSNLSGLNFPSLASCANSRDSASVKAAYSPWSPPKDGIFRNHLDYANWYVKQWALRMMDVTENYDPDIIYTDGTMDS